MADTIVVKKANGQTSKAIYAEIELRRQQYFERDRVAHNIRRYRLMRHRPYMPKSYQRQLGGENAVKMPIMYRLVQTAVNAVAKGFPTIYVEPTNAQDQRSASELGTALQLLIQSIENQSRIPFLYSMYFNLFGDGLGVTKVQSGPWSGFPLMEDAETPQSYMLRVEEYMGQNPYPFQARTVDPLTFYPPMDEYGRGVILESGWRSLKEVAKTLHLTANRTSSGMAFERVPDDKPWPEMELPPGMPSNVRVDEVWGQDGEVAVCIAGRDVIIFQTPEEQPYTWGYAEPTGVHDPSNVGMSVVYPLYYVAPWIDTLNGIMTAWALFSAPTPYTTQDPVPGVRPTAEQKIDVFQPGKMYHFPTGRKPGILSPPPTGDAVREYLNFLIEAADRGGLPALVSGSGVGTRLPALTFQAAFEAATDRLRPATQSAEHIIAGTLDKILKIIGQNDIAVRANGWDYEADPDGGHRAWATIKPNEARKQRQITVKLQIDSTQDMIGKGTHAQFMVGAQLWDVATGMRFAGVKDVQKTKDAIAADTAWRAAIPVLAQAILANDPDFIAYQQASQMEEMNATTTGLEEGGAGQVEQQATQSAQGGQREQAQINRMNKGGTVIPAPGGGIGGHGEEYAGKPAGPGRNRGTVPAGRGGGRRGAPTQRRRGAGKSPFGRT